MTKLLEQAVSQARELPDEAQDSVAEALFAHIAAQDQHYGLSAEQLLDVKRTRQRLRDGETRLATDDEVAAVWKKADYEGPLYARSLTPHLCHPRVHRSSQSRRSHTGGARVRQAADDLGHFPEKGRNGAVGGTREWVVKGLPYIIVYETIPEDGELAVLGIYHGAQLRPGQE